ncbi:MAG: hypothetical protein AAGI68_16435 [Planctomycetota bacterium]
MRRNDVIALIAIVIVGGALVVLVLPLLGDRRGPTPRFVTNNTQLRGIHQSMVIYALGNKGHFPGLDSAGVLSDPTMSRRLAILLDTNAFTPDYIINPLDDHLTEAIDYGSGYVVSIYNHSFAGLDIRTSGRRRSAWSETLSRQEIVLSDRNTGPDPHANVESVWSGSPGVWSGSIAWNDNSTRYEESHIQATDYSGRSPYLTSAATAPSPYAFPSDNLFEAAGPHDAWMVHD